MGGDQREAGDELRVVERHLRDHLRAHGVADEDHRAGGFRANEAGKELAGLLDRGLAARLGGVAEAGEVEGEHAAARGELGPDTRERRASHADAVDEDEGEAGRPRGVADGDLDVAQPCAPIAPAHADTLANAVAAAVGTVPAVLVSVAG